MILELEKDIAEELCRSQAWRSPSRSMFGRGSGATRKAQISAQSGTHCRDNADQGAVRQRYVHLQIGGGRNRDFDGPARAFRGRPSSKGLCARSSTKRCIEGLGRRSRGQGRRRRTLDGLLQFPTPSSGNEQPDANSRAARRHTASSRRRDLWICRFAWTTQTPCPHTHGRAETTEESGSRDFEEEEKGRAGGP